ncbi:uncharacterized protein SPPG_03730 [Spizellomyces punctatus DAOM BR117]|uniref:TNase-like domain-containing protein n=1 Tax=Spizellomyces punctatus (strain DAOM BR117) TaxID=645134 RepID=A0A0L0HHQ0_SPIPD|nr:uncharacterized protein SPPG_03730 [Spizellomyces punctatus DAOM BR117]KND00603.1 hypothetical protein SPPG_03730 [Spizellomyces punctatus DAOM BR117]|eukprot:XP_016608642.1 hypothetical protein SPPG_03730 [Spizellomyces punctatus DAOM BR117]
MTQAKNAQNDEQEQGDWLSTLFANGDKTRPAATGDTRAFHTSHHALLGGTLAAVAVAILVHPRSWRRYKTADYMTPPVIQSRRKLYGICTDVKDNDNFRLYHTPLVYRALGKKVPTTRKELQNETIHVRLAGIDAPEGAHFGMTAQPFHVESKEWLSTRLKGQRVVIKPLRRDHYGRMVCMAWTYRPFWPFLRNVSLDMLQAGYATLYEQAGAEYDGMLLKFQKAEMKARASKKGMWGSSEPFVSPAQHKKTRSR